jgi:DNA-binding transcriptional MerR regulator
MLSIGEFSKLSQVSIKTLRFYHEIGLLNPIHVDRSSGYRYYSASQLTHIRRILAFKEMGFSLDEIEQVLEKNTTHDRLRERLLTKRDELQANLNEGQEQIRRIDLAISQVTNNGRISTANITVKGVSRQLVASLRSLVPTYEDANALFDELGRYVKRKGGTGTLGAIWHNCGNSGGRIDCEAVVFLRRTVVADKRVTVYELPATRVAAAIHEGDANFTDSYVSANRWIASNNWRRSGPNREVYLKGGYSNDEAGVMEIQFPVERPDALQSR